MEIFRVLSGEKVESLTGLMVAGLQHPTAEAVGYFQRRGEAVADRKARHSAEPPLREVADGRGDEVKRAGRERGQFHISTRAC